MEKHFFADRALAFDLGEIIRSDGIDQPGDDVLARVPFLLGEAISELMKAAQVL